MNVCTRARAPNAYRSVTFTVCCESNSKCVCVCFCVSTLLLSTGEENLQSRPHRPKIKKIWKRIFYCYFQKHQMCITYFIIIMSGLEPQDSAFILFYCSYVFGVWHVWSYGRQADAYTPIHSCSVRVVVDCIQNVRIKINKRKEVDAKTKRFWAKWKIFNKNINCIVSRRW